MTIPYLTGFADPNQIKSISDNLQELLNPNKKIEDALKKALIDNPGLIQQYADIEANSPGTLKSMGYGKTGQNIAKTPQSYKGRIDKQASAKLTDPMFQEEAIASSTGTKTTKQRKVEDLSIKGMEDEAINRQLDTRIKTIQADMAPLIAKGETAQIRQKLDEIDRYNQAKEAVYNKDTGILKRIGGMKNLYLSATGKNPKIKLSDEETGALLQLPEFKTLYDSQQEDYWKQKSLDTQKELANIRVSNKQQFNDYIGKRNAELASRISEKSGNPSGVKFIFDVLNNPTLGKGADPNYIQAANTIRDFQAREATSEQQGLFSSFRNMPDVKEALNTFADPKKMKDFSSAQVQNMVDLINSSAQQVFAGSPNTPVYQVTPVAKGILGIGKKFGVKQVGGIGAPKQQPTNNKTPTPEETKAFDKDIVEIKAAITKGEVTKEQILASPQVPQYIKDRIR